MAHAFYVIHRAPPISQRGTSERHDAANRCSIRNAVEPVKAKRYTHRLRCWGECRRTPVRIVIIFIDSRYALLAQNQPILNAKASFKHHLGILLQCLFPPLDLEKEEAPVAAKVFSETLNDPVIFRIS
jgi:hypothetical protein